jgi:hypothetical protein
MTTYSIKFYDTENDFKKNKPSTVLNGLSKDFALYKVKSRIEGKEFAVGKIESADKTFIKIIK